MIIRARQIMKTNKILAILLISKSREPYFDLGFLELIFDLVSFPVYNTRPYTSPWDANTEFYHIVFSKASGSLSSGSSPIG
jgi:hypothetical protein